MEPIMTASTAYFTCEREMLNLCWNKRRKSTSSRFATRWLREALSFAVLLPSLIAETTPLLLYWNAHLPVWQMSLMMFGAWTAAWWGTQILANLLRRRGITAAL
jgi:hypothetical protein